jgi:signal transduction histidine kinase
MFVLNSRRCWPFLCMMVVVVLAARASSVQEVAGAAVPNAPASINAPIKPSDLDRTLDAYLSQQSAANSGLRGHADSVRARQVVINLLTNAGRHTPPGGEITVHASRRAQAILVEVWNTGSSLDAEQLQRVFDRFYRADPARQRMTGGTGLGLTIVKYLVEAHAGSVSAASDASGVTIGFTLPAAPEP